MTINEISCGMRVFFKWQKKRSTVLIGASSGFILVNRGVRLRHLRLVVRRLEEPVFVEARSDAAFVEPIAFASVGRSDVASAEPTGAPYVEELTDVPFSEELTGVPFVEEPIVLVIPPAMVGFVGALPVAASHHFLWLTDCFWLDNRV